MFNFSKTVKVWRQRYDFAGNLGKLYTNLNIYFLMKLAQEEYLEFFLFADDTFDRIGEWIQNMCLLLF